jgi:soluble lytic murein transglycosylase
MVLGLLGSVGPRDPAELLALLEQRQLELKALQQRIHELEWTEERRLHQAAQILGVVSAVEQSGLPERQRRRLAVAIVREARRNGLDPLLVVALIRTESSFDNYARSNVGALGLMQVMPETGKWIAARCGSRLVKTAHLFDSELNIELGTAYLANLLKRFGSLESALVAYNAGPTAARKILADRSARDRAFAGYPRKVVRELRRLRAQLQKDSVARVQAVLDVRLIPRAGSWPEI